MKRMLVVAAVALLAGCGNSSAVSSNANDATEGSAALKGAKKHLLVGFKDVPGQAERNVIHAHGGEIRHEFPKEAAFAIDLDEAKVGELAREGRIAYVEEDAPRFKMSLSTSQLSPSNSNGLYGLITTGATAAHAAGYHGEGIVACVADTSLDTNHPDIAANYVEGVDAVGGIHPNSSPNVADGETHGTHVSGTILGVYNSEGVYGVAYKAQLKFARVLGPNGGTTSDIMAGVQWLKDHGCHIVNLSLGGGSKSRTEENFYKRMRNEGLLVVVAAGNESAKKLSYPAGYSVNISVGAVDMNNAHASFSNTGRGIDVSAPGVGVLSSVRQGYGSEASVTAGSSTNTAFGMEFATHTSSSGVSATLVDCGIGDAAGISACNPNGKIALIQRGTLDFATKVQNAQDAGAVAAILYNNAAGDFIGTLGAATDANGNAWIPAVSVSDTAGAALAGQAGGSATVVNMVSDWDYYDGTSMATPHTVGVLALILQANGLTGHSKAEADQAENILKNSALDLGAAGYDTTFGYGLVQAP